MDRRRNDAAPALARTRIPSCAPPVEPRHPGGQQRRETVDEQPLQERPLADAEVRQRLVVELIAPHSHWKATCSSQSRASLRALPTPSTVA